MTLVGVIETVVRGAGGAGSVTVQLAPTGSPVSRVCAVLAPAGSVICTSRVRSGLVQASCSWIGSVSSVVPPVSCLMI